MKLNADAVAALDTLLQTANAAGIEKLIIGNGLIRGIDEKKTVAVVTDKKVPDLDGKSMTLTRIKPLIQRLAMVKAGGELNIDVTVAPNGVDISMLDMQGGKSKTQFRCASLEAVKGVPKGMSDPAVWEVKVASKTVPMIAQADASMGETNGVTLASKDGVTVAVELTDTVNKDVCSIELDDPATWVGSGDAGSSFCHKYTGKALLGLLREAAKDSDTVSMRVGQNGLLMVDVAGITFCTLPHTV